MDLSEAHDYIVKPFLRTVPGVAEINSSGGYELIITVYAQNPPPGFTSLFNGKDFTGWKVPEGDNGHWKVINGVIDYDAESESTGDKSLWTMKEYKDYVLYVDWRIKSTPWKNTHVPIILPDGSHKKDENGKDI